MIVEEVRLWKLTRRHVRQRLEQGLIKGAILPTGSTEQHNEHLAMEHDTAARGVCGPSGRASALSTGACCHADVGWNFRALDGIQGNAESASGDFFYGGL